MEEGCGGIVHAALVGTSLLPGRRIRSGRSFDKQMNLKSDLTSLSFCVYFRVVEYFLVLG
jgi:hypothetical protein